MQQNISQPAETSNKNLLSHVETNFIDTLDDKFTKKEKRQIEEMREQIKSLLAQIRWDADAQLARFDSEHSFAEKCRAFADTQDFVFKRKVVQTVEGLAESGWDVQETNRYLLEFGVGGGFGAATNEQIEEIWLDMKAARMIF
ncbi:MAG: hypothetical protein WA584_23675 [Pyrinomonadaceae bacterium]